MYSILIHNQETIHEKKTTKFGIGSRSLSARR